MSLWIARLRGASLKEGGISLGFSSLVHVWCDMSPQCHVLYEHAQGSCCAPPTGHSRRWFMLHVRVRSMHAALVMRTCEPCGAGKGTHRLRPAPSRNRNPPGRRTRGCHACTSGETPQPCRHGESDHPKKRGPARRMPTIVILGVKYPWVPACFANMRVSPLLEVEVGVGQAWREIPSLPSFGSFPSGSNHGG